MVSRRHELLELTVVGTLLPEVEQGMKCVEYFYHGLLETVEKLQTLKDSARFKALFPMNPHKFLTAVLQQSPNALLVCEKSIDNEFVRQYRHIALTYPQLYLAQLGKFMEKLRPERFFKVVAVREALPGAGRSWSDIQNEKSSANGKVVVRMM